MQKLRQYYDQCVEVNKDFAAVIKDGLQIKNKVEAFIKFVGKTFEPTMFAARRRLSQYPLHDALAYLQMYEGVETLVTQTIQVNAEEGGSDPNTKPKMLYFDEPTLMWPKSYYQPAAWKKQEKIYRDKVFDVLKRYRDLLPAGDKADDARLKEYINKFIELEQTLAKEPYATDETKRRTYTCTPINLKDLASQFNFIQWSPYVGKLISASKAQVKITPTYQFGLKWKNTLTELQKFMVNADKDTIGNYLFMRLLVANSNLIPNPEAKPQKTNVEVTCGQQTQMMMMFPNGKAMADLLYPTEEDKKTAIADIDKLITTINYQFLGMVDELDWLVPDTSKQFLVDKVKNLQKNILYPDLTMDKTKLDQRYVNVEIGKDYFETTRSLQLNLRIYEYSYLAFSPAGYRDDFIQWPGTVNAWYEVSTISIESSNCI